ncbi:MAG: pilin [Candidatus Moraniibacteriota bacterium]
MNKNKYFFLGFLLTLCSLLTTPVVSASHADLNAACTAAGGKYASSKDACIIEPSGRVQGDYFNNASHEKNGVCCVTAVKSCTTAGSQYSCVANVGSCTTGTEIKAYACSDASKPVCCFTPSTGGTGDPVPNISGLNYQLLEKIPGTSGLGSDLPGYVSAIYKIALIVVTLSAVLMLSVGGFMYLTSAGNTSSISSAKTVITDALIGLVIALSAWLVLFIINPDLVKVSLSTLPPVAGSQTYVTTPPADGGTCSGCVPVDIPVKPVGQGCKAPGPCKLEAAYLSKLKTINSSQAWQVTEAHPPTVTHASTCHYNGRCSDINFTDKRIDVTSVKALYDAIKATGLSVVYETFADCAPYTTAGVSCKRFTNTTGSHFHVY